MFLFVDLWILRALLSLFGFVLIQTTMFECYTSHKPYLKLVARLTERVARVPLRKFVVGNHTISVLVNLVIQLLRYKTIGYCVAPACTQNLLKHCASTLHHFHNFFNILDVECAVFICLSFSVLLYYLSTCTRYYSLLNLNSKCHPWQHQTTRPNRTKPEQTTLHYARSAFLT